MDFLDISSKQKDNTKNIDVLMLMHLSIEYRNNYSKISGSS